MKLMASVGSPYARKVRIALEEKKIAYEFEQELGLQFLIGIEPEMMWLRKPREGEEPQGVTKPYCYHIHQFEELRPVRHRIHHDDELGGQLQRQERFLAGRELDRVEGDFLDHLLEIRGHVEAGAPEDLAKILGE